MQEETTGIKHIQFMLASLCDTRGWETELLVY